MKSYYEYITYWVDYNTSIVCVKTPTVRNATFSPSHASSIHSDGMNTHFMTTLQKAILHQNEEPVRCALIAKELSGLSTELNTVELKLLAEKINNLGVIILDNDFEINQLQYDIDEKDNEMDVLRNELESKMLENRNICEEINEKVNVYSRPLLEVVSDILRPYGFVLRT